MDPALCFVNETHRRRDQDDSCAGRGRRPRRRQRPRRPRGGRRRGARRRAHDAGRPLRLLRGRRHPGGRREHRLVPPRGHDGRRGHRHRVRAARQGPGRDAARVPVAERSPRSGAVQVRRRRDGARRRRGAAAALSRGRADPGGRHRHRRRDREQVRAAGDPGRACDRRLRRRRHRLPGRGALPHDARRRDDGRHRDVLVLGRGQGALPRLRQGESPRPTGIGARAGRSRRAAKRTISSVPTSRSPSIWRAAPGSSPRV